MKKALLPLLLCLFLAACATSSGIPAVLVPDGPTPSAPAAPVSPTSPPPAPTVPATRTPPPATATPAALRLWFDPSTPLALRNEVTAALSGQVVALAVAAEASDLRIVPGKGVPLAQWVYALAAPFPTLADDIALTELKRFWSGELGAITVISGELQAPTLFATPSTLAAIEHLLGSPAPAVPLVTGPSAAIIEQAWAARPQALAIVPFDELETRWKALTLDGASVLDKALDIKSYPLTLTFGAEGQGAEALAARLAQGDKLLTNREVERMTVLMMTGCTALVRATAYRMEQKGVLYPGEKIAPILRSADLTHISNEIPFAENCPPPSPVQDDVTFCSSPRYIELLRSVGTDVVELTGNHFEDYGPEATLHTLEMYRQEGWPYYGGGANLEEARRPLILERNGNRFSFIGCNPVGPGFAWATDDRPGSAPCDATYLHDQLAQLQATVDVPIATFQYWEFYDYAPTPQQQADFRALIDAGAKIVSGSQSHHPQAFEFYQGGFIHYGPGNLFFDQMYDIGVRQEFVDCHIIYKGKHISTALLTFMLEDYAQPRPMTLAERRDFLATVFQASGW